MGRFDWADKGIFDIGDLTDEEFKSKFNTMSLEEKQAILDDLKDATADAAQKKKTVDFLVRAGELLLKFGGALI